MEQQFSPTIQLGGGILDSLMGISQQLDITSGAGGGNHALDNLIAANAANYSSMMRG
jgi:hypothetical protein